MNSPAALRGSEVRQRLLSAAVELIPERGWAAVSTRILAERAGVSPSVVHYHFPSLAALLNESVVGVIRQVLGELDGILSEVVSPVDAVDAMLEAADQYAADDPLSLLSVEACLAATRDEELRQQIADAMGKFRRRFGDWLDRHGVPAAEETAAVLMAALDGLLLHRGLDSSRDLAPLTVVLYRLVGETRNERGEG